ncbi:MAG TPA: hypothetical protein VMS86_07995, partial [Thermoanaerobaculia bacterium]|nr:hypothetical protein [Thermoanaerobaculia bacterium]
ALRPVAMRFTVETWAPEYGSSFDSDALAGEPEASVDLDVELPAASWRPIGRDPTLAPASSVLFVDGVRRIDARIWIPAGDTSRMGICASYAAGVVRCYADSAQIEGVEVERSVIAPAPVEPVALGRGGAYQAVTVASDEIESLTIELQRRLGELEVRVIGSVEPPAELTVVDGHLRGREDIAGAVGYIKSHRASYLSPDTAGVVGRLAPGERTPLFVVQGSWSRFSWYLRLPAASTRGADGAARREAAIGHPWAGIVRCELAATLSMEEARRRADLATATLPRYASEPHKDPRAPQNLYPIGGLEQELRRRLGDRDLLYRDLIRAAG